MKVINLDSFLTLDTNTFQVELELKIEGKTMRLLENRETVL